MITISKAHHMRITFSLDQKLARFKVLVCCVASLLSSALHAQEFKPEKSPDVTSFMQMNYLPLNEYTGNAEIKIPLYTINMEGMQIPIEIVYNTSGVNIDASASRVGLNWSLNAGGMVMRETVGQQDLYRTGYYNPERAELIFTSNGYLADLLPIDFSYSNGVIVPIVKPAPYRDTQPDLLHVAAPGLKTKFIHKADGSVFDLQQSGYKINGPYDEPITDVNRWTKTFGYEIINTNGIVYSFHDRETNAVFTRTGTLSGTIPLKDNFYTEPFPLTISEEEIFRKLYYPILGGGWGAGCYEEVYPVVHLTSITNPRSGRIVKYYYSKNYIVDNERHIDRYFSIGEDHSRQLLYKQVNYEHDFSVEKVLDKIVFPDGTIDFYYDGGRLDVPGGKILRKIEIRNHAGKFIKGMLFEHDYFRSKNCSGSQCYRLQLKGVKFFDKDNNVLPGYTFGYNATALPKRYSLNKDYSGYHNGYHKIREKDYRPKLYFKSNQGKNSYLPFPFPEAGYHPLEGNASLEPNLLYAKAGTLEKITYPTGGHTLLEYELNSYLFQNTPRQGGGLRIVSQTIYDGNAVARRISYNYNKFNTNTTSGRILNVPRFTVFEPGGAGAYHYFLSQYSKSRNEHTQGNFVGYSTCKVAELNNGYVVNTYSNPEDVSNIYPQTYTLHGSTYSEERAANLFNNGYAPEMFQSMDVKRGALLSSQTYDNNNGLLKEITNTYSYFNYGELPIIQNVLQNINQSPYQNGSNDPHMRFGSKLISETYALTNKIVKDRSGSSTLTTTISYSYDETKPVLKEVSTMTSKGEEFRKKLFYPFDGAVSSLPNMDKLTALNIVIPVRKVGLLNAIQQNDTLTNYAELAPGKIFPQSVKTSLGQQPANDLLVSYDQYDKKGNPVQYTNRSGIPVTTLWGYNYQYKIAEVVGATYSETLTALEKQDIDYLQEYSNNQLSAELNVLRTALPNAKVYTYLHTPLEGINAIVDPNERESSFTYDTFGRLISERDNEGNLLSNYSYNLRSRPTANFNSIPLTLELKKGPVDEYRSLPVDNVTPTKTVFGSDVKGGRGDYHYEWTELGSNVILGTQSLFSRSLPCGASFTAHLKVTDLDGTELTKTLTSNARACSEAFYLGNVENVGPNKYSINAEGGSYRFSYRWLRTSPTTLPEVSKTLYDDNVCPLALISPNEHPHTFTLKVMVTDTETGSIIERTSSFTVPGQVEPPSCFIAGTKIVMADGSEKVIEEVKLGDLVMTYNLESKLMEAGKVESVVSPIHSQLVEFQFGNLKNTNTTDHPYFVKGKGWCSFDPVLTATNYRFEVKKIEVGDTILRYDAASRTLREAQLTDAKVVNRASQTYNLEKVSKNHNYFANGILVHNKWNREKLQGEK